MTRPSRHGAAFALVPLTLFGFALGCGSPDPAETSAGESQARTLRLSQGSQVSSMDPYLQLESPTFSVLINIFDTLTDISPGMELVPALATGWSAIEPTVWEFKLREGVTFHDGAAFDAEDVRYSILRARDWPKSRLASEIPTVASVEAVDPMTVRVRTTIVDAILPRRMASIMIVDAESTEAAIAEHGETWLTTHPNGTGPYRLERWVQGDVCVLAAHGAHWRGAPSIERIEFRAIGSEATRVAEFLDGQLQLIGQVPVRDVDRLKALERARVISNPGLRLIYLGFDVSLDTSPGVPDSPPNPLRDLRVRQAIDAAIDRDLIVARIMNGQALAAGQLFAEGVIGHDGSIAREPHDPDKARRLLAEAGYADGFRIRFDGPNDRYVNDAQIMTAIAADLAKVGIEVEVNARPKAQFFEMEESGECSFFLLGWTNSNGDGAPTFDHLLHTADPAKNLGGANASSRYSNPELDRIVEASASEIDPAARARMLQEANRIVMRDLPHLPLHFQMDIYAASDELTWTPRRDTQLRGIEMRWREGKPR